MSNGRRVHVIKEIIRGGKATWKLGENCHQNLPQGFDISTEPCKMCRIYPAKREGTLQAEHILACHLAC